jgi:glycosyltransferase A (GT-A) superfamily protein (DUF2064 family)
MIPNSPHPDSRADVCLVLLFKSPARSKRRLAGQIGGLAQDAAQRLWDCALEDLDGWPGPGCFAPADAADLDWLDREPTEGREVVLQRGGNLGERLNHVDRSLRSRGCGKLLFVGMDCPAMDPAYLHRAAQSLQVEDTVLGPAHDGGVVLMGARLAWPRLDDLPWSTTDLYGSLIGRCRSEGLSVSSLEPRGDVDTVDELLSSPEEFAGDDRPGRRALADWLRRHRGVLRDGA